VVPNYSYFFIKASHSNKWNFSEVFFNQLIFKEKISASSRQQLPQNKHKIFQNKMQKFPYRSSKNVKKTNQTIEILILQI